MILKLKQSFFSRETTKVAVQLLGQILVRVLEDGTILKGKIIETEAYLGIKDPSCHSFKGLYTNRTRVMYRLGGCIYVYFTYGMHHCLNIVTAKKEEPEAVLIRALEPLQGMEVMQKNRGRVQHLTDGPGKLCQALQITKKLNGESLDGNIIYIEKGEKILNKNIIISHRIGLSPLNPASFWPLRFYINT